MKKVLLFVVLSASILMTSCGGSASVMGNSNVSQTNVELSKKNFNILGKVSGKSSNTHVFFIGGMSNRSMLEKAKNDMMANANLSGSKAVINVTYDKHYNGFLPFYSKVTVTASAYIVEFTE